MTATVKFVETSPASGDEGVDQLITITLAMSDNVTVSGGTPKLILNDGGVAVYDAVESTPTSMVFDYTVTGGQNTSSLAVTAALTNGASISDGTGNAANLSGAIVTLTGLQVGPNSGQGGVVNLTQITYTDPYAAFDGIDAAIMPDGSTEVIWADYIAVVGQPYTSTTVNLHLQRYSADGSTVGPQIDIASAWLYSVSSIDSPVSISVAPDGSYSIDWVAGAGLASGVYYSLNSETFAKDNSVISAAQSLTQVAYGVNPYIYLWNLDTARMLDGGTAEVWAEYTSGGGYELYLQRYAANGGTIGPKVNIPSPVNIDWTSISAAPDGSYSIYWVSDGVDSSGNITLTLNSESFAKDNSVISAAGPLTKFQYSGNASLSSVDIARLPNGGNAVLWADENFDPIFGTISNINLHLQRYADNGSAVGSQIDIASPVNIASTSISAAPDGSYSVDWLTTVQSSSGVVTYTLNSETFASLFTSGDNSVDFNNLSPNQQAAISEGAGLYRGFGGNDVVTLPNKGNYDEIVGNGQTLGWQTGTTFITGDTTGKLYTVIGGDGNDSIQLGDGNDVVIGSPGNDTIKAGLGQNTFDYQTAKPPLSNALVSFAPNTVQTIVGRHALFQTVSQLQNVIKLPDSPNDYTISVSFGSDTLDGTKTTIQTKGTNGLPTGISLITTDVERAVFQNPISTPNVALTDGSMAAEAIRLSNEVYGYSAPGTVRAYHLQDPLAYESSGNAISNQTANAAIARKWFPLDGIDLGMGAADFGTQGPIKYSFVNGYYQSYATNDAWPTSGDHSEADALVLVGNVGGLRTLALSFSGTDQWADWWDYFSFQTYYAKYAPLMQALTNSIQPLGIQQILVSGHSLGAGALQYFTQAFSGALPVYAYTVGSPGSEVDSGDTRIVNFIHTDDPVPKLGTASQAAPALAVIADAFGFPLVGLALSTISPKARAGESILIDSDVTDNSFNTKEHDVGLYQADIGKLLSFAGDTASPFHVIADAIKDNTIASVLLSTFGGTVQVAVGQPHATGGGYWHTIRAYAADNYVLGNNNSDDRIVLDNAGLFSEGVNGHRIFDGGTGTDKLIVPMAYASVLISPSGTYTDNFATTPDGAGWLLTDTEGVNGVTTVAEVGVLYRVEQIVYRDITVAMDGHVLSVQTPTTPHEAMARAAVLSTAAETAVIFTVDPSYDYADAGDGDMTVVGSSNADIIYLGYGNKTVNGGDGDDIISVTADNPTDQIAIDGGAGADVVIGGIGNETYYVDNPGDQITVGTAGGSHTIVAALDYELPNNVENLLLQAGATDGSGNDGDNTIDGNAGDNNLFGLGGSDILKGETGNDTLDGGTGADTMIGGLGNDTYAIDNVGDVVTENASEGNDLVNASVNYTLPTNVESLVLTEGAGPIAGLGNGADNYLQGNSDNNALDGGSGADYMVGGAGNDTYTVDNAGDAIVENGNEGNDVVHASIDYTIGANIESLILDGTTINGAGNATDNAIIGNASDNIIDGRAGADFMVGGAGNDIYFVDNAGDSIVENPGEGNDIVHASIDYTIGANIESLILDGTTVNGAGNNTDNAIIGNANDNIIDGKSGSDFMQGGAGNDIYFVDNAGDAIVENVSEGNDIVHASISYTIGANIESLILDGSANLAGAGNTTNNALVGNSGDNNLDGRGGQDFLIGNGGNDTFEFKSGEAAGDLVADFAGNGSAAGDSFLFLGFGTMAQGATFTQVGATNQWQIHSGLDAHNEVITLQNSATVHASDFVFV